MDQYTDYVDLKVLRARTQANDDAPEGNIWPEPDLSLLGTGRRPAPPFLSSILGGFWRDWVEQRARGASAPIDYVATSLLVIAGALLANVRRPSAGAEWSEPTHLWIGNVGSPSAGKSPGMSAPLRLLYSVESCWAADFQQQLRDFEMKREAAEARREEWKAEVKAAVKGGSPPPIVPAEAVIPDAPTRPRVQVTDATIERLAVLAAALPRGLLQVRDELSGLLGSFDRYGGNGGDRAFYLQAYIGQSYTVDRMKNPEPVRIRHLSIGVLGGIQPDRLAVIVEGDDDGLAARFLWRWPDALPEFKLARELADNRAAEAAIARLADLTMGIDAHSDPVPVIVPLTSAAEDALEEFACDMNARADEAAGGYAGALGKARGQALRLAAILEFLWWAGGGGPEPAEISKRAMLAACGLVDGYFIPMAERVFNDARLPVAERNAMALARYLRREHLHDFNARAARAKLGGALREAAAMAAACEHLTEAGLIRERFTRAGDTAGRKALNYEVNPVVFNGSLR